MHKYKKKWNPVIKRSKFNLNYITSKLLNCSIEDSHILGESSIVVSNKLQSVSIISSADIRNYLDF